MKNLIQPPISNMELPAFLKGRQMKWSKEEGTLLLLALAYQSSRITPIKESQKSVALDLLKTMEEKIYNE